MKGTPSCVVISLSLPAISWVSVAPLDHAGARDQEQGLIRTYAMPGELHAPAAAGNWEARWTRAARMNPANSGWPSRGVEVNSG